MTSPWERVDVSSWEDAGIETVGSDGARWLIQPRTEGTGHSALWLHKSVRVQKDHVNGEDWAEVATTVLGRRLGIPSTPTQLCTREGVNGSLSLRIHDPQTHDFREGHLILLDYGHEVENDRMDWPRKGDRTRKRNHNLATIRAALADARRPRAFIGPDEMTAFDVFTGYLCLDALVANRDRHEQNWAVLEPRAGPDPFELAPSFDHGSAFGYNLAPAKRMGLIENPDKLADWAARGTAHRLEHTVPPPYRVTLVDAAAAAVRLCTPAGKEHWKWVFLKQHDASDLVRAFSAGKDAINSHDPQALSVPTFTLVELMVKINLGRLRDALRDL